jgi:thioredoxin-related protein
MKRLEFLLFAVLMLSVLVMSASADEYHGIDGLNTTDNLSQAIEDGEIQNRTVMAIFSQDNCYYCDIFKEDTSANPDVQKLLNEDFIVADIDINKQPEIAAYYQVFGTPTTIVLYDNGDEQLRIEGYVPSEEFLHDLKEI